MAPQLTIFYSGSINVYNNISAEKAHAIMLLLGSCNGKKNSNDGASGIEPLTSTTKIITVATPQPEKKPQLLCRRSQAELPYARKASLARFLEKRKDRIQETAAASASASGENGSEGPSKKMKLSMENPAPQ